jgi:hypothetical protein
MWLEIAMIGAILRPAILLKLERFNRTMFHERFSKWNRSGLIQNQVLAETALGWAESSEVFMTNRASTLVPRMIVATMMASAALVTGQLYPAGAADECVTKPGEAPAGKHWFYRSDRVTKRQCWFLRDSEGDSKPQGASLTVRKSAAAAHKHNAGFSRSAANAHAELSSPSDSNDDDVKVTSTVAAPAMSSPRAAVAPPAETSAAAEQLPDPGVMESGRSPLASRWPESAGVLPAAETATRTAAVDAAPRIVVAEAAPNAEAQTITPETAVRMSVSETGTPPGSSILRADDPARTQLIMFLCAVAVVGFSSSMLLNRARRRRIRLEPVGARRATRWPAEPQIDRMQLPTVDEYYPALIPVGDTGARVVRPSIVSLDDERAEVEDLLARYSGQARIDR